MIELRNDKLTFSFPKIHPKAKLTVGMQRTIRIPDDGKTYPLPPGLGKFPLRHVDDFAAQVPESWRKRGGVMMPMYQSEALWINFSSEYVPDRMTAYPFAIKVATGKVNAVTGEDWSDDLDNRPQDYMVAPNQPWMDGYCIEKGKIRQFVAMPLGEGYTAEEQIIGEAEFGGIQIKVYPMASDEFDRRFPVREQIAFAKRRRMALPMMAAGEDMDLMEMGIAPGGQMRQEIYDDPFGVDVWDKSVSSRCFVSLANSLVWQSITGKLPPHAPMTAKQYSQHGMPWFDYYSDDKALQGSSVLDKLKSVVQLGKENGKKPVPENQTAVPEKVIALADRKSKYQVREGDF